MELVIMILIQLHIFNNNIEFAFFNCYIFITNALFCYNLSKTCQKNSKSKDFLLILYKNQIIL